MKTSLIDGMFDDDDLAIMQRVFDSVTSEPWFTSHADKREEFAIYVMRLYRRGLVQPDRLEGVCRAAAKTKFARRGSFPLISGRRFLIVEDEYATAREASERLAELGAEVIGPVASVSDALDIVEHRDHQIDGALLDISLHGETVYPVAAFLKMRRVPFAFVTGYEQRQVPPFYRSVPTFSKPADWASIASALPVSRPRAAF